MGEWAERAGKREAMHLQLLLNLQVYLSQKYRNTAWLQYRTVGMGAHDEPLLFFRGALTGAATRPSARTRLLEPLWVRTTGDSLRFLPLLPAEPCISTRVLHPSADKTC